MKCFEPAEAIFISFAADVITTSGVQDTGGGFDGELDPADSSLSGLSFN